MLTSITPLGERGRGQRWVVTVAFFMLGAAAAGAASGAALGWAGHALFDRLWVGWSARALLLAGFALMALALELSGRRIPGPRRQVSESWLPAFRGWVYGGGFGVQLGSGVTTIVSTTLVYLTFLSAFVTGSTYYGFLIGLTFGAVRGAAILPAARVHTTASLQRLARRVANWRAYASRAGLLAQAAILVALVTIAL